MSFTERKVLISSADNNAQSYNDEHHAHDFRISTAALPTKRNWSTNFLEIFDKLSIAGLISSMEDEVETDAELDNSQNGAGQIGSHQLSSIDEVHLSIQDYNNLKKPLEVPERLSVFLESSRNLWKVERTKIKNFTRHRWAANANQVLNRKI